MSKLTPKTKMRYRNAALLSLLYGLLSSAAHAQAPEQVTRFQLASNTASQAPTGRQTLPPIGWVQFCREYARDSRNPCNVSKLQALDVIVDAVSLREMNRINNAVNGEITPITDIDHWGLPDKWDYPDDKKGDCEDYVIEKRDRLMKRGFPRQALLITVVRDKMGDGHAVLTVKTDRGDLILDNQEPEILAWTQTGYEFIKRQSQEDPNIWVSIGTPEMRITASR